jgi:hypothetical protein
MNVMFRLTRSALLGVLAVVVGICASFVLIVSQISNPLAGKCTQRPKICGHRVVGDEATTLGFVPTLAMPTLFELEVQCFDGDVIR